MIWNRFKQYKDRGFTRDSSKPAFTSQKLKGAEVIKGDVDDKESLMQGTHTIFAVTTAIYDDQTKSREPAQGKVVVDAAVAAGVHYLISGGKYQHPIES